MKGTAEWLFNPATGEVQPAARSNPRRIRQSVLARVQGSPDVHLTAAERHPVRMDAAREHDRVRWLAFMQEVEHPVAG